MTTIDTPAILKGLDGSKTELSKDAAVTIRALAQALLKTEAERDGMVAKVEEYKARTRQAEKAHDASGAMVRELQAEIARDGVSKVDPPLPLPVDPPTADAIKLAVAAENERCAKIAETIDLVPHPEVMCAMNAWQALSWGRVVAASLIRGGTVPALVTKIPPVTAKRG